MGEGWSRANLGMFSSFWTNSLFSENSLVGRPAPSVKLLPNLVKSFSQEREKEKEKLKSLENVHFQNHFSKQTFQVFLSKLHFLLTFACLIIYLIKGLGGGDLKYLGYLTCCLLEVFLLWEKQTPSAQGPTWCVHRDYHNPVTGSTRCHRLCVVSVEKLKD